MEERKIDYSTMPGSYEVCWHTACPLKDNCLRYLASSHLDDRMFVSSVNLNFVHPETGECENQRPGATVRVAWGLRHIYDNLPYRIKDAVYSQIHYAIGNTTYYHYYNERKPIPPRVQEYIGQVFRQHGVNEPVAFRRYEDRIDW